MPQAIAASSAARSTPLCPPEVIFIGWRLRMPRSDIQKIALPSAPLCTARRAGTALQHEGVDAAGPLQRQRLAGAKAEAFIGAAPVGPHRRLREARALARELLSRGARRTARHHALAQPHRPGR